MVLDEDESEANLVATYVATPDIMTIILPTIAVAFAAFCLWLAVRIFNRRERWAKWTLAAVVGLPVVYVASFGPACWWFTNQTWPKHLPKDTMGWEEWRFAPRIYWPIGWLTNPDHTPMVFGDAIFWYAALRHSEVVLPTDYSGTGWHCPSYHEDIRLTEAYRRDAKPGRERPTEDFGVTTSRVD